MAHALRLQQLVDVPILNLKHESATSFFQTLCLRFGITAADSLQEQFHQLLNRIFENNLGFWIADYVACICADPSISSSDPEEFTILQPTGVLAWCESSAADLHKRVLSLFKQGAAQQPDHIIDLCNATKTLLSVAQAVQAALGSSSNTAKDLTSMLQLLHQTSIVLQFLEQLQQQRPGHTPLITRSASTSGLINPTLPGSGFTGQGLAGTGGAAKPCPAHDSLQAWQAKLVAARHSWRAQGLSDTKNSSSCSQQGGRLFLDDLLDQLLRVSAGQRALAYPFPDVLSCVEGLFMSGSSSSVAWQAKLALLLYYLLDGGWLTAAGPFAQGFQLPLTTVQQWQCHFLLDVALSSSSSSGGSSPLDLACSLLGATACPATPFRFVEALLAAGRPTTALAVQRARCAASSRAPAAAAAAGPVSLYEAQVLLRVQLGCGLLAEAFSEMRRHCSQLPPSQRMSHVKALMQQLAAWAAEEQQQQQQVCGLSRLQLLCQLPLDCEEEAALLGWFRSRLAAAGEVGGHMMPLYLLQRGRSLEALAAYTEYRTSPAAAAAAASNSGGTLLQRQLQTLMSAAAAALPPSLRAIAVAAAGAGSSAAAAAAKGILAGVGSDTSQQPAAAAAVPTVTLRAHGVEPPVFMAPLIPAAPGGADFRGGMSVVGVGLSAAAAGSSDAAEAAAAVAEQPAVQNPSAAPAAGYMGSLFGSEVLAEAGPGKVVLGKAQGFAAAGSAAAAAAAGDYVPLLFGTPAPVAAASAAGGSAGFMGAGELTPAKTPGSAVGAGFSMSEAEFSREVLGIQGPGAAAAAAGGYGDTGGRRSSKRQRQTPVRFQPGPGR